MGKQIQFYLNEDDEDDLLKFVKSTGNVFLLPQVAESPQQKAITSFRDLNGSRLGMDSVLWNGAISAPPLITFYPVHGGCYCVDTLQSDVINVMRSKRTRATLSMGRLQIETAILTAGGIVERKSNDFIKWFDKIAKWLRKSHRERHDGAVVSIRVAAMRDQGLELVGHR